MRGIGTVVNVVTVLAGTAIGLVAGSRLPERLRSTVLSGVGLLTLVIGIQQATQTRNVVFPLVALISGAIVGEVLGIEERLEGVGARIRRRVEADPDVQGTQADPGVQATQAGHDVQATQAGHDVGATQAGHEGCEGGSSPSRFVEGFVAASLLFCVGPLTILGSIKDGLGGPDHAQLLFVKSALDGLVAVVFASTLGWGVGFSALTILAVQGSLTLAAGAADRVLTARMIDEMTATGGVMILGIGLRLLDLKQVRVASFLPALVVAPVAVALFAR